MLLVCGELTAIKDTAGEAAGAKTEGMEHASKIYRIDWNFKEYMTVALRDLEDERYNAGFDISGRDRLRSLYALKLQQDFGNKQFRVGHPIMPPIRMRMRGETFQYWINGNLLMYWITKVFRVYYKEIHTIKITSSVGGKLRRSVDYLHNEIKINLNNLKLSKKIMRSVNV